MMKWFSKPPALPKQITIQLTCIHCAREFEQWVKTSGANLIAGVCECCLAYGQMEESAKKRYLEFLRRETESTRKDWIVRQ